MQIWLMLSTEISILSTELLILSTEMPSEVLRIWIKLSSAVWTPRTTIPINDKQYEIEVKRRSQFKLILEIRTMVQIRFHFKSRGNIKINDQGVLNHNSTKMKESLDLQISLQHKLLNRQMHSASLCNWMSLPKLKSKKNLTN